MTGLSFNPFESDKPRVLVVDDDADINRLLQVRLRNVGFAVTSAPDGETAIDMIWRDRPDMILLDISMPGISGLEVLDRIRKDDLDVAVVMTTAFGSEAVAIDALRRGADDYLRKPFEPGEFRAVIDRTLGRVHLRRQNEQLRKHLDAELKRAAEIQRILLPDKTPSLPNYDFAAVCQAAREVGGDFYDWYQDGNGRLGFTLGDVMGKGLPAALLMTTVRASLKPAIRMHDPATSVNVVASALEDDLARTRSFVTMFVGSLDTALHEVTYVDAGHGLAVVVRGDGKFERLTGTDVPVGIFPDTVYRSYSLYLGPGDALLIYSDGLQDTLDSRDVESLATQVWRAPSAAAAVASLVDLARGSGEWTDDVTLMVMRREAGENGA
jgi:phosphoserine phosphatase RsbU/P